MTKSEQARADALADAETLLLAAPGLELNIMWNVRAATDWMRSYLTKAHAEDGRMLDHIVTYVGFAAEAAFRAVPGLRGDR